MDTGILHGVKKKLAYLITVHIYKTPTTTSTQPNLTSSEVGFDMKMTLHTTHHPTPPSQTQLPSRGDKPKMLPKQEHQEQ